MSLRIKKKRQHGCGSLICVFCLLFCLLLFLTSVFFYFFQGHISDFLEWQQNLNLANSDKIVPEREREREE